MLLKFLHLLREGNTTQCEMEYNNLPPPKDWLLQTQPSQQTTDNADSDSDSNSDEAMEEDPEWTTVKSRKRR